MVPQPQTISNYNKYTNAVERSHQILATNNVLRKCTRWWKTLFFHLIDTSPVQSTAKPAPPPLGEFETVHIPVFTKDKKHCVVCFKKTKADNIAVHHNVGRSTCMYVHVCDGGKRTALQSFTPGIIISLKFIVYYCNCALFLTYIKKKINKKIIK